MANVLAPAFAGYTSQATSAVTLSNQGANGIAGVRNAHFPLFHFDAATASAVGSGQVTRLYARDGDIVGLRSGETLAIIAGPNLGQTWYEAAGPVWMLSLIHI